MSNTVNPASLTRADVTAAAKRARALIPRAEHGTASTIAGVTRLGTEHEISAAYVYHRGNPGCYRTWYTVKDLAGRTLYTNTSAVSIADVYVRTEAAIAAGTRAAHVDVVRMDGTRAYGEVAK